MNDVLLDLPFLTIKWYSFFLALAILSAFFVIVKEAKKKKVSNEEMIDVFFYTILFGILGARIYYVALEWEYYGKNILEIFMIWKGGLAIHGGILFGFFYLMHFAKKKRWNFLLLLDVIVVGLILGQAIGRWGNFFNGEAYGRIVSKEFLEQRMIPGWIIQGMWIDGHYREPAFLYESIGSFIGFVFLLFTRKNQQRKVGQLTGLYCIWYGFLRFFIEGIRADSLMIGSYKMAQVISIISIILGIYVLSLSKKKRQFYHKENMKY